MKSHFQIIPLLRGLVGAAAGGVAGYYGFAWLYSHGFYAMVLPGVAVGFGFGLTSRHSANAYGAVCAVIALVLSIYVESQYYEYGDNTFSYLLLHVHEIQPVALIMMGLGVVAAYVLGRGRPQAAR